MVMSKIMQNLVFFMDVGDAWVPALKAGNLIFNRFCIDEDAAFELSGVNYLQKSSFRTRLVDKGAKGRAIDFYGLRPS